MLSLLPAELSISLESSVQEMRPNADAIEQLQCEMNKFLKRKSPRFTSESGLKEK